VAAKQRGDRKWSRIPADDLAAAVEASRSISGVLRVLGITHSGTAYKHIRARIAAEGFSVEHFDPYTRTHLSTTRAIPWHEILVRRAPTEGRRSTAMLRRALVESGRDVQCALCEVKDTWNGSPITLHIDHTNGVFTDDRPQNLRFLCPNCHSQQETSKRTRRLVQRCVDCGTKTSSKASLRCKSCANRLNAMSQGTKIEWPSNDLLREMLSNSSYLAVGRSLGVSDNAVRKRLRREAA